MKKETPSLWRLICWICQDIKEHPKDFIKYFTADVLMLLFYLLCLCCLLAVCYLITWSWWVLAGE